MQSFRSDSLLKVYEYEIDVEISRGERIFRVIVLCSLLLFGGIGLYLRTHNPPPQLLEEKMARADHVIWTEAGLDVHGEQLDRILARQ